MLGLLASSFYQLLPGTLPTAGTINSKQTYASDPSLLRECE